MCGICGTIERGAKRTDLLWENTQAMLAPMVHRGPDGDGIWTDTDAGVSMGHRRLSIRELSPAGAQPMASASGRYILSYNGEIYNSEELRADLEECGSSFRGCSDTEVLVEACATWGVETAVKRLIGMFAFALYDRVDQRLWLVRDRIGIKPLYYCATPQRFTFASELTSLSAHPDFDNDINYKAVDAYLALDYIPAPHSIYRTALKLEPGTILRIDARNPSHVTIDSYWSLAEAAYKGAANRFSGTLEDATDELEELLCDAVKRRMVSDVPIGAFLSGGIDSTCITTLMQKQSTLPVKTFSIGFPQSDHNEAHHAKAIAGYLGTDHTELYISDNDICKYGPSILRHHDEPFADPSLFPTWFLSRLARRDVKVALSGDGADELFGGYSRHLVAGRCFDHPAWHLNPLPKYLFRNLVPFLPRFGRKWAQKLLTLNTENGDQLPSKELKRLALMLRDPLGIHHHLAFGGVRLTHRGIVGPEIAVNSVNNWLNQVSFLPATERQQFIDLSGYLPDNILTKVDRASMALSLEARVPFLDHRVVEFALSLPPEFKTSEFGTKRILKNILSRHMPVSMFARPKMGFGAPTNYWVGTLLRGWTEEMNRNCMLPLDKCSRARQPPRLLSNFIATRKFRQSDFRKVVYTAWWNEHV